MLESIKFYTFKMCSIVDFNKIAKKETAQAELFKHSSIYKEKHHQKHYKVI